MNSANDDLPVLTDMVSNERCEPAPRPGSRAVTLLEPAAADATGYDPYNSAPPVVDLRNRS